MTKIGLAKRKLRKHLKQHGIKMNLVKRASFYKGVKELIRLYTYRELARL